MKGLLTGNTFRRFFPQGRPVTGKTPVIADRGKTQNNLPLTISE
jgi:hypothetical protein